MLVEYEVEKGIFSLANLIKNKRDISLTIVGAEKILRTRLIKVMLIFNSTTK